MNGSVALSYTLFSCARFVESRHNINIILVNLLGVRRLNFRQLNLILPWGSFCWALSGIQVCISHRYNMFSSIMLSWGYIICILFLLSAAWSAFESCILQVDAGSWAEFGSRWSASCWPSCCPNFCQTSRDSAAEEAYWWWQVTRGSQHYTIASVSNVNVMMSRNRLGHVVAQY